MVFISSISIKGPLGVVWLAAHLDRQLKRNQVDETSITGSVDAIINNEFPQLRLSSQLLLGVVRIYTKKVGYLFKECNEALVSIRDVSQKPSGGQAATAEPGIAPREAITLPDSLELDEMNIDMSVPTQAVPPLDLRMGASTSMAAGDDDGMFGVHLSGPTTQQFEDLDGEIPFDLAVDDLHRMQTEPAEGPGDQQPDEQLHGHGMEPDMVDINLDLDLNLDETEQQEQTQQEPAEAAGQDPVAGEDAVPASGAATPAASGHGEEEQDQHQDTQATQDTQTQPDTQETQEAAPRSVRRSSRRPTGSQDVQPASSSQSQDDAAKHSAAAAKVERRRAGHFLTKRPVQVDAQMDPETKLVQVMSVLPGQLLRQLLENRAPLLTERGTSFTPTTNGSNGHARQDSMVAALQPKSGASTLYGNGLHLDLAEPLQELYCVAMDLLKPQELGDAPSPAKKPATRKRRAAHAADAPDPVSSTAAPPEPAQPEDNTPATPSAGATQTQDHQDQAGDVPTPAQPTPSQQLDDQQAMEPDHHAGLDEDLAPAGEMPEEIPEPGQPTDNMDEPNQPASSKRQRQQQEEEEEHMLDGEVEPLPAHVRTDLTQGGVQDDEEAANDNVTAKSFTRRTRVVVAALQAAMQHAEHKHSADNGKRRKPNAEQTEAHPKLHLSSFVKGQSRLHASRWFFELLVLKAKGVVELEQPKPFADVAIQATQKLAEVTAASAS